MLNELVIGILLLCLSAIGVIAWYIITKLADVLIDNGKAIAEFGVKIEAIQKILDKIPKIEQDLNNQLERIRNLELHHVKSGELSQ